MAHVGTESFYKTVIYDLQHAIADGYVIYYEGVKPDPACEKRLPLAKTLLVQSPDLTKPEC